MQLVLQPCLLVAICWPDFLVHQGFAKILGKVGIAYGDSLVRKLIALVVAEVDFDATVTALHVAVYAGLPGLLLGG